MNNESHMEQLPDEVLFDILLRLDIPELHALSFVTPHISLGKDMYTNPT